MNDFNIIIQNYKNFYPCLLEINKNYKNLKNSSHLYIFSYLVGYYSYMKINISDFKPIFEEYKNDVFDRNDFFVDFKKITNLFCNYFRNKNDNVNNSLANSNNYNNNDFIANSINFSKSNINDNNPNINNQSQNFYILNHSNVIKQNNNNNTNSNINNPNMNINNSNVNINNSNVNINNSNNYINNYINNSNVNINNSNNYINNYINGSNMHINNSNNYINNLNRNIYNSNSNINNLNDDYQLAKRIEEEEKAMLQIELERDALKQKKKCEICLEDFSLLDVTNYFLNCNCVLHNKCFDEMVKTAVVNNTLPVKCPNCGVPIHPNFIEDSLRNANPQLLEKYEKFSMNNFIQNNSDQYSSCPTPGCEYLFFFNPGEFNFLCPLCKKNYCLNCKDEWHKNMTCQQYKDSRDVNKLDNQFFQFVKGAKFKMCPKCKYWVEKNQGCNHMKCRCGADFCYLCGDLMNMNNVHKCRK